MKRGAGSSLALMTAVLLTAAGLRIHALTRDTRFHPDEALFSTFARNAAVQGDWMLSGALDKTPLSIYASALSIHFFAIYTTEQTILDVPIKKGEFAARLPNTFAGILTIALTFALAKKLSQSAPIIQKLNHQDTKTTKKLSHKTDLIFRWVNIQSHSRSAKTLQIPVFAALLAALSPMLIIFSASAFTDPLMVMFGMGALVAVAWERTGWSGALLALSIASKQQGIFYLPLVVGMLVIFHAGQAKKFEPQRHKGHGELHPNSWWSCCLGGFYFFNHFRRFTSLTLWLKFLLSFLAGVGLLLLWDKVRGETSIFALAAVNNNPGRVFAAPDEWLPRLSAWLAHASVIFGGGGLTLGFVIIGMAGVVKNRQRVDLILALYIAGYGLLHWLAAFNIYDRYLLPLVPLLALLAARGMALGWGKDMIYHVPTKLFRVCLILAMLALSIMAYRAADTIHHANEVDSGGILALADFLNSKPLGTIIYDHWLGWEMGYYLSAWTDKRRVYYPMPEIQAEDALSNPDPAIRYLIAPMDENAPLWVNIMEKQGFRASLAYQCGGFVAYALIPPWASPDDASAESSSLVPGTCDD